MKLSFLFASSAFAGYTRGVIGNAVDLVEDALVTEVLHFKVHGKDVDAWNELDDEIWTNYLAKKDGFVRKTNNVDRTCNFSGSGNCDVYSHIDWTNITMWKAIDEEELANVTKVRFDNKYHHFNEHFKQFDDECKEQKITQQLVNAGKPEATEGLAVIASTSSNSTTSASMSSGATFTGAVFALVSSLSLFHL